MSFSYVIIGIVCLLAIILFNKQLIFLTRFITRSVVGSAFLYAVNFVLNFFGFQLGVNLITFFILGFFGIWGLISVILAQVIL
ncbi:MAG: pro-sigmaK processing inhibitor BofA family protein [Lachnospirales bacterium]